MLTDSTRSFLDALPATIAGPAVWLPDQVARPPVLALWDRWWREGEELVAAIAETADNSPPATGARLHLALRHLPDLALDAPPVALGRAVLRDQLPALPPRLAAAVAPLVEPLEAASWHALLHQVGQRPLQA